MQTWYPEGYFFAYALYRYTLVNQVLLSPDDVDLRARNIDREKRYYLGAIVVADEFQVWGKTIVPWEVGAIHPLRRKIILA